MGWWTSVNSYLHKQSQSYWITRFVLLRALGVVYLFAFLSVFFQIVPLVGSEGLTPTGVYLDRVESSIGKDEGLYRLPSLFWIDRSDTLLKLGGIIGILLSLVVVFGYANGVLMFMLWILYLSYINIGQHWYSFGWEIQLIETGFLALFLVPFWDWRPFPSKKPPVLIMWLFRWLGFRIMLGAGLIKIRGDECWTELTCLIHHYQTQPIPNPLSPWLHFFPVWMHKLGVLWNHFIELVVPWFMFYGKRVRWIVGSLLISFQFFLILSGNLSFLNWLTIVPFIACLDDGFWRLVLPKRVTKWMDSNIHSVRIDSSARKFSITTFQPFNALIKKYHLLSSMVFLLVLVLSVPVVLNLFSSQQKMNSSFFPLPLVNTYGAFGSVGDTRYELVVMGTSDQIITDQTRWKEYEFKAKPTSLERSLPIIAPYHLRLDWLLWFAAMSNPERYPWMVNLVWKLLENNPTTLELVETNPFGDQPPTFIKVDRYVYEFNEPWTNAPTWKRTYVGPWLPPLSKHNPQLREFVTVNGWE